MRFQLLGPLSIREGNDVAVLRPSKPAILLAALLVHPNTVVSTDRLLRAVWNDQQPATAKAALQTCVLRLRRIFAEHGIANNVIEAVPGGYRITATADTLDLLRFRETVRAAAAARDSETELYLLREALLLWQGPLLANIPSEALQRDEVPRLTEERLRAAERVCDIELALGRCRQVLVDLWGLARSHPGHERFSEQLIEALYRTGRQAEALSEYRRVKTYLLERLAVDPGPGLRNLELAILRGGDLGPAATSSVIAPGGSPKDEELVHPIPLRSSSPVPAPLCFTGRESETLSITARLAAARSAPGIVVLSGSPGIGKTALALQVAHLVRESFPDGLLFARMTRADGSARTSTEVAAEFLGSWARSADVDTANYVRQGDPPVGREGQRALLVLDDVVSPDQVRRLLPTGAGSAAIITSRRGLAGLVARHGGWVHRLDTFDDDESHHLLVSVLGAERVDAEPAAARKLALTCGHFPIALRVAAARLLTRPRLRIADCVDWLRNDPVARLSLADDSELSVARIFTDALHRLDPRLADAFVRIGCSELPANRLSVGGCASVLDTSVNAADEILEQLVDHGLLEEGLLGHYRMHPLLALFAEHVVQQQKAAAS